MAFKCTEPSLPDLSTLTLSPSTEGSTDQVDSQDNVNQGRLSPTTQEGLNEIVQLLLSGEATIGRDYHNRPVIQYKNTRSGMHLYWDPSNANILTTPKAANLQQKMDAFFELIEDHKTNKYPSGVNLDSSMISLNRAHLYEEGSEFEKTQEILGTGNSAGDIVGIKDKKTGTEHARKKIMISVFRKEEIQAGVDIGETGIAPKLYLVMGKDNYVHIHMEKLENVVTLRKVIDSHMETIRSTNPDLVRPFSLFFFHGLISAVRKIHENNWTHRDLHAGNILLQRESDCSIKVRIVDFGLASKLDEKDGLEGFRMDIKECVRKLCALYVGQEFNSHKNLDKDGTWKADLGEAPDLFKLSPSDRVELFNLVSKALQIVAAFETQILQNAVQKKMENIDQVMKKVIPILFPFNVYQPVNPRGQSTMDSSKCKIGEEEKKEKKKKMKMMVLPPRPPPRPPPMPLGLHRQMDESRAKKQKTEDQLIPEGEFLKRNEDPVTFKVVIPKITDKAEWKLNGQTLSFTLPLTDTISAMKAKLNESLGLPAGKQKLQHEGIFMKDSNSMAYYNFMKGATVHLQLKDPADAEQAPTQQQQQQQQQQQRPAQQQQQQQQQQRQ